MKELNTTPNINLNGHLFTVGEEGIKASFSDYYPTLSSGVITSSASSLLIYSQTSGTSYLTEDGHKTFNSLVIDAVIANSASHKVGVTIKGNHPAGELGMVILRGSHANTFTGDVIVEGKRNRLYLNKDDGVTAIRGDIYVRNKAMLVLTSSNQIADSSRIVISGSKTNLMFTAGAKDVLEKISSLVVQGGRGVINFGHDVQRTPDYFKRTLLLEDLIIEGGASLRISKWQAGRDFLLVRKNSPHLADALKKISIDGWAQNQVYLKNYNRDYWSIEAAPEAAGYGAVLGALGLGLAVWRQQRNQRQYCNGDL